MMSFQVRRVNWLWRMLLWEVTSSVYLQFLSVVRVVSLGSVKAVWPILWQSSIRSTDFIYITQRGRCRRGDSDSLDPGRSYLDKVLIRSTDIEFVSCPTFHCVGLANHKLVLVSAHLGNRPRLVGYWKFNTSFLEIQVFRDRLEYLIQRALMVRFSYTGLSNIAGC